MSAKTDEIRAIRESKLLRLTGIDDSEDGQRMMLAAGERAAFAACYGRVRETGDGGATLDADAAARLGLAVGDSFLAVGR